MRTRPARTPSATRANLGGLTPGASPGVTNQPTANAATGYASRYPPVSPSRRAMPTSGTVGVNTGRPAMPSARYSTILAPRHTRPADEQHRERLQRHRDGFAGE